MKYLMILLTSFSLQARTFNVVNGEVQPFSHANYPLKELIKDYAILMNLNVTYPSDLIRDKDTVHVELNSKASLPEFKRIFYELLSASGFSPMEEKNVLWLVNARDMRYMHSQVYTDDSFPRNAAYYLLVYKLKYPLSSEIARNLRPFMSRFGRVIDLSDARTVIIHDQGVNIERIIGTIQSMDNESSFKAMINQKPEPLKEEKINCPPMPPLPPQTKPAEDPPKQSQGAFS